VSRYLLLGTTIGVYVIVSVILFVFGTNLIVFSIRAWRRGPTRDTSSPGVAIDDADLPFVTVQLPIYNELYVSERIIDAVVAFDYPRDRLQIQVLDDSTDETTLIIAASVAEARARGINITHVHRSERVGYKAGALAAAMDEAAGEYIAMFDADFVPAPDFLRRCLPRFDAPNVAFVQARWGHVNRDYSWLTRLQALAIDGHFLVEQAGRSDAGYWFNFNGTAGIWRADAIADAGGWKADTLTEDLDLSYRAHLRGWCGRYLEDVVVPAEVPAQMTGFRRQQHRWARGSLECAYRLLPQVWRSGAPLMTRVQATLHLTAYFIQLLLMVLLLIYPLVVLVSMDDPRLTTIFGLSYVLALTSIAPTVFFATGSRQGGRNWIRDFPLILVITAFGAGLMVNTARAALQIFTRPNPSFERTAKFGLAEQTAEDDSWKLKRYQLAPDRIVYAEIGFALYAVFGATLAWRSQNWGIFAYASIFAAGLFMVAGVTISHTRVLHRHRRQREVALRAEAESFSIRDTASMSNVGAAQRAVVLMAKRPAAGATKTRLAPAISMQQAADLYERFLIDTLAAVTKRQDCTLVVAIDDPGSADYFAALAPGITQVQQEGATLGERLDSVMSRCLELGFDQVFALGTDSPDLPGGHLSAAFEALQGDDVDVVLGPTDDGGYYLIGWKRRWSPMVTEVKMSTPTVLADTLDVADGLGARVSLGPAWYDVDCPEDLTRLRVSLGESRDSHTADFLTSL